MPGKNPVLRNNAIELELIDVRISVETPIERPAGFLVRNELRNRCVPSGNDAVHNHCSEGLARDFGLARYHSVTELRQANASEYGTKTLCKCFVFRNGNCKSLIIVSCEILLGMQSQPGPG
jgi:hypothetical protein